MHKKKVWKKLIIIRMEECAKMFLLVLCVNCTLDSLEYMFSTLTYYKVNSLLFIYLIIVFV